MAKMLLDAWENRISLEAMDLCRYRWLGVRLGRLQWWGALSYFAGMLLYLLGDVASLANDCPRTYLSDGQFVRHPVLLALCKGLV